MKSITLLLLIFSITLTQDLKCGESTLPGCLFCNEDPTKGCRTCVAGARYEERDGVTYCVNIPAPLASKNCGSLEIPGCETCADVETEGCKICHRGAGIEEKDGLRYCIRCPVPDCELCHMTPQGRQCQKCFEGFTFDEKYQTCNGGWRFEYFIVALVIGLLWF